MCNACGNRFHKIKMPNVHGLSGHHADIDKYVTEAKESAAKRVKKARI